MFRSPSTARISSLARSQTCSLLPAKGRWGLRVPCEPCPCSVPFANWASFHVSLTPELPHSGATTPSANPVFGVFPWTLTACSCSWPAGPHTLECTVGAEISGALSLAPFQHPAEPNRGCSPGPGVGNTGRERRSVPGVPRAPGPPTAAARGRSEPPSRALRPARRCPRRSPGASRRPRGKVRSGGR